MRLSEHGNCRLSHYAKSRAEHVVKLRVESYFRNRVLFDKFFSRTVLVTDNIFRDKGSLIEKAKGKIPNSILTKEGCVRI